MTLITGFIYKNTVQIIADSAETMECQIEDSILTPNDRETSFGEIAQNKDYTITESAQKIYVIEDKMILTFAGDVREGEAVVEDIRTLHSTFANITDFLTVYFRQNIFAETQYIIGYYENDTAKLCYCYENGNFAIKEGEQAMALAGMDANLISQAVTSSYYWVFNNNVFSTDNALAYIIATIQWYSTTFTTINRGVGGFFNGCYISSEGISWSKDTLYLLYSFDNYAKGDKHTIIKYNRGNSVFVISRHLKKVFMPTNESYTEILNNYGTELEDSIANLKAEYYIMFAYDHPTLTAINKSMPHGDKIRTENGKIAIEDPILKWMFNYGKTPNGEPCFVSSTNFDK
jgi:hypothetical protein